MSELLIQLNQSIQKEITDSFDRKHKTLIHGMKHYVARKHMFILLWLHL